MELHIIPLTSKLNYYDDVINLLYDEWHDIYKKYGMNSKEDVKNFYDKLKNNLYIGLIKNKLVGCYSITKNLLADVCVNKDYRKRHIGRELVKDALRRLWYYYVVKLYCNKKMVKFYKDCGFEISNDKNPESILMIRRNHMLIIMVVLILLIFALIWCDN